MKKICPHCHYPNYQEAIFCISCQEEIREVEPTKSNVNTRNESESNYNQNSLVGSRYVAAIPEDITTLKWIFILIGLAIPIFNIIVIASILILTDNETLRNFAKASIIMMILSFTLYFSIVLSEFIR